MAQKNICSKEIKDLTKEIEALSLEQKKIVLAALEGMLLAAKVSKAEYQYGDALATAK